MPGATPKTPDSWLARFLEESSFLRHYLWKYRKLVAVGLLALLAVDLLEILPPILMKDAVDVAAEGRPRSQLAGLALAYAVTAIVQGFGRYGWRMYLIRSSMFSGRDLRGKFSDHLFSMSASFFDRRRIGELMSLATNDVEAVRMAIGAGLLTLADALFYILSVPAAMFWLSPKLTFLALLPLPLIPWFVIRHQEKVHERFEKVQESFSRIASMAQENLNGIRVVKGFARENAQIDRFKGEGEEYVRLSLNLAKAQTAFGPTLDFTMSLGLVLLLFFGGKGVIEGAVGLGTFVAFQRYIQKMIWPMTAIGMAFTHYQRSVASSDRIKETLAEASDIQDPHAPAGRWKTTGQIEFRDLSFAFPSAGTEEPAGACPEVLRGIKLTIEPGERVAFLGAIGSGKTALLSTLPRLYPVAKGMVWVDGTDINDWPLRDLREQIGYVSQDVFLFSMSVAENIAFGLHDWTLSQVSGAAATAGVREEIERMKEGYRTRLGERGLNLSGGQKQRVTLARALARNPGILILDDALSSVDVATEERILRSLRARPGRNTELIAAHRISTVKEADRIVVLEKGRIIQEGTHSELLREKTGLYHRFYEQQRLKDDLEAYLGKLRNEEVRA